MPHICFSKLGHHWFRWWLVAWRHQIITWTNVDLSSERFRDIELRGISHKNSYQSLSLAWKLLIQISFKYSRGQRTMHVFSVQTKHLRVSTDLSHDTICLVLQSMTRKKALIARLLGPTHLGPTGPRWVPCWPHELFYLGVCWVHSSLGTWTWTVYPRMTVLGENIDTLWYMDVKNCHKACRAQPSCVSVDYRAYDRSCWRNYATGMPIIQATVLL